MESIPIEITAANVENSYNNNKGHIDQPKTKKLMNHYGEGVICDKVNNFTFSDDRLYDFCYSKP